MRAAPADIKRLRRHEGLPGGGQLGCGLVVSAPASLGMVIVSPYAGRLAARWGFRIVVTIGLALGGLGLLALALVHADTTVFTGIWLVKSSPADPTGG